MLGRLGFPAVGRQRRLVAAIGIDALGSGTWIPMSVLYFAVVTDIGLVRIGAALSIASLVALPFALVGGHLVDRYGAKRVLQCGNVLQAVGFVIYPFLDSAASVAVVATITAIGRTLFFGSFGPLVVAVTEPGEREQWFGFLSALRNAGFAVGGLAASAAIGIGTDAAFHAVVVANAASYLVSFLLLLRTDVALAPEHAPAGPVLSGFVQVLRDRGYRWLICANTGYALGAMALNVAVPVYLVHRLELPGWISGAFYVVNTVLITLGQGLVIKQMAGARRWRMIALAAVLQASAFALLYLAGWSAEGVAIAIALAASVVYTLGEATGGPVLATLAAEAPPEESRGRYMAVLQLSWNGSAALAPVLYLWLLAQGPVALWGTLAAVVLVGALCCLPLRRRMPLASEPVATRAVQPSEA